MGFWRRMHQSKIDTKLLWNYFTRSYLQIHSPVVTANGPRIVFPSFPPPLLPQKPQFHFPSIARLFAAPAQSKKKREVKDTTSGPRLNDEITADLIRLVTDEGHSIVSKHEALKRAEHLELDLVEVHRNVEFPVCKIMDYHKQKYVQDLKAKELAKSKSETSLKQGSCKEVRVTGKISKHDLKIKAELVRRLMADGYRVKCVAIGNTHLKDGESSTKLLSRFSALIEDISIVESKSRVEEKDQTHIIVRHNKFGPLKKGLGKKVSFQVGERDDEDLSGITDADAEGRENDFDDAGSKSSKTRKLSRKQRMLTSSADGSSDNESPYGRETAWLVPQSSNSARQTQPNMNASPQRRETERPTSEVPTPKSPNIFENGSHQKIPYTPTPSNGIFNAQNNAPGKHNMPTEVNRYKQRPPSDHGRHHGPPRHGNVGRSNSRGGWDQGFDKNGQGRYRRDEAQTQAQR